MTLKVADKWYAVRRYDDDISLISEIHIAPWLRCNIWHVRGRDCDLLIDTGMGLRPLKSEIARLVEKPVKAVMTHSHFDHAGGAHEFSCRLGHKAESHLMQDQNADEAPGKSVSYYPFVQAETFRALPYAGFDYKSYAVRPAPFTDTVEEGDRLDTGDRSFEILHLPGHSPGSIGLYERNTGTLFTGDALYDAALLDTIYHSDKTNYRATLARLAKFPANIFHGGHFQSFGQDKMQQIISEYLAGERSMGDSVAWVEKQIEQEKAQQKNKRQC